MSSAIDPNLELIRTFLPKYLTPELTESLFKVVREDFPSSSDPSKVYIELDDSTSFYQGDNINDIPFSFFEESKGTFKTVYFKGVIMSNTCDISSANERLESPYIQFAGTFLLNDYINILEQKKINRSRIDSFLADLRLNKISNLFYLPAKFKEDNEVFPESFIRFDLNVSLNLNLFSNERYNKAYFPIGDRNFSFSNYGFYLFIIKLSIHYSRIREGVFRNH